MWTHIEIERRRKIDRKRKRKRDVCADRASGAGLCLGSAFNRKDFVTRRDAAPNIGLCDDVISEKWDRHILLFLPLSLILSFLCLCTNLEQQTQTMTEADVLYCQRMSAELQTPAQALAPICMHASAMRLLQTDKKRTCLCRSQAPPLTVFVRGRRKGGGARADR